MSLADRLEAARKPVKPKFEQWIEGLDKADQEALAKAAVDPELSNAAISDVVRAEGYAANKDTISKWRRAHGYAR